MDSPPGEYRCRGMSVQQKRCPICRGSPWVYTKQSLIHNRLPCRSLTLFGQCAESTVSLCLNTISVDWGWRRHKTGEVDVFLSSWAFRAKDKSFSSYMLAVLVFCFMVMGPWPCDRPLIQNGTKSLQKPEPRIHRSTGTLGKLKPQKSNIEFFKTPSTH